VSGRRITSLAVLGLLAAVAAWWWLTGAKAPSGSSARVIESGPAQPATVMMEPIPEPARPELIEPTLRSRKAEDGPQDSADEQPGIESFSGWYVDERGEPLPGHILVLSQVGDAMPNPRLEASTVTEENGRFEFRDLQAGSRLIEALGRGEGDLPVLVTDRASPTGTRVALAAGEGRLYLTVPQQGLCDVNLVGPRHASFWVDGRFDREIVSDKTASETPLTRWGVEAVLQRPAEPVEVGDRIERRRSRRRGADLPGLVLRLMSPEYRRIDTRAFVAGADDPEDTQLVISCQGYAEAIRNVSGRTENVGTIQLARVASLSIEVCEAGFMNPVRSGSVEVKETGGGRPDRQTRHELDRMYGGNTVSHDCDRRTGHFELRVCAPGYRPWEGAGDLAIAAEPQHVLVELLPAD